jgi:predicted RND superfamily exporter protein
MRHPRVVLLLAVLITIFLGSAIPKLEMRSFFEGDLPADDPHLRTNEKYVSYFGEEDIAYLAVVHDTIYTPSTLAKIVAITNELNALDPVLEKETLSLATVRRVRWREWGLDVRKYLAPVPTPRAEVERLRRDIRSDEELYGKLVSEDETATLLAVKLSPGYDRSELYTALHAIADKYAGPEKIYPFGRQIMNEEANIGIAHDSRILGPAAVLLVALGITWCFRSPRHTFWSMLMIITSIIWAMGLMYYLGFLLSMLSSSVAAILVALGSSYMIHVIYSCGEHAESTDEVENIMTGVRKIARPIALAAGTSMVGFATLVVFKILSIREFGISVAAGVGFAALLSLVVLPSIFVLQKGVFPAGGMRRAPALEKILDWFARAGLRYRYLVLGVGAVSIAVSIVGISKIKVGFAPEEIFPPHHRAREVVSLFIDKFHGPYTLYAMFSTKEPNGLKSPEALKEVDAFQEFAEGLPNVEYADSIVDVLKRMNQILNEDAPEFYSIPETRAMIAQSMLLYSMTNDPTKFENLVDYDYQRCKVTITTTAIDSMELEEIHRKLTDYCEDHLEGELTVDFGGHSLIWLAQNEYIIVGKIINIIANTVLIWIICAFAFRSARLGLLTILPLSLATLATFGLMGHLGIRLDTATAVITGISVGVGVDFAIHFISRLKRESLRTTQLEDAIGTAMQGSGRAIIYDAISNVLGFMTFLFSGFAPVRTLGVLICFTMISCVVLTLIFVPAIIATVPIPFRHRGKESIFFRKWLVPRR